MNHEKPRRLTFFMKTVHWLKASWITGGLSVVLMSCNLGLDDISKATPGEPALTHAGASLAGLLVPDSIALQQVDLFLDRGPAATGTVTVEIRSMAGTLMGSLTVPASSLAAGASWKTFAFPLTIALERKKKYRLSLIRSDPHDYASGNYIFWRTSASKFDAYPDGVNDVYPLWTLDYAFRTHIEGGIGPQQTFTNYGFYVSNKSARWQELVADYPKVNLTHVELFLTVGPVKWDTLEVQVRGLGSSYTDSIIYKLKTPLSSLPTGSHWNSFPINGPLYLRQSYQIYVRRPGPHNPGTGSYVFWHASRGDVDAYPQGSSDISFYSPKDYAFRTYSQSGLDQQQPGTWDTIQVARSVTRWQEFVPVTQ